MKSNITAILCRGFNKYFDVPLLGYRRKATCRTAVVVKKNDFHDEWSDYADLFVELIGRVAVALKARIGLRTSDMSAGVFPSVSKWREWCECQIASDPECFGLEPITEVSFELGVQVSVLMSMEDWSDIGGDEPYSCSFTYSFYSCDRSVDEGVADVVRRFLESAAQVSTYKVVTESSSPKWYWRPLNALSALVFG